MYRLGVSKGATAEKAVAKVSQEADFRDTSLGAYSVRHTFDEKSGFLRHGASSSRAQGQWRARDIKRMQ